MELIVVFGQPGSGKTYIGKLLQKHFGFYFYEGDDSMPQALKDAIVQEKVTDEIRETFFNKLISTIKTLQKTHKKIVLSQTFIKEKYRKQFLEMFPQTKFILIETDTLLREKRLLERKGFQLPLEKWRKMAAIFEKPQIKHVVITNNEDETAAKQQLQTALK